MPTKAETHSPTAVAKVPPYLAINPQLFDSSTHWSYRDLQKLAKRLELRADGKREELVERLRAWHRAQRSTGQSGQFHAVQVRATPDGKEISPSLLSPLVRQNSARDGDSQRGILSSARKGSKDSARSNRWGGDSPGPLQQRSGVLFSPYNMVKLIPSKEHSEMYGQYREPSDDDWDAIFDDDDDEL